MSILFAICAILCMAYYIAAASYAGAGSSFLKFWPAAAAGFMILSLLLYFGNSKGWINNVPVVMRKLSILIFAAGVVLFCVLEGMILSRINAVPQNEAEYLVVLGAQVRGKRITRSLAGRLDAACSYAKEHEDVNIVVSGGQGKGEDISEAQAMKNYLMEKGIDEKRIVMEDKSTSTRENLRFSDEMLNLKNKKIAVVTNNFHVYRAIMTAKRMGYKQVEGLAGKADRVLFVNYMVREAFAILKEYLFSY